MEEILTGYECVQTFQKVTVNNEEPTKIILDGVFAYLVENYDTNSYNCYIENQIEKTYAMPVKIGLAREFINPLGAPFSGTIYFHFADSSLGVQSGSLLLITYKLVKK